jgi:uncharacterized protein (TIRG00374 family)
MNKLPARLISSLKFIVFLGIGVLLMYFAFRNIDLKRMLGDLKKANYAWIALALVFSVISNFSRAYRWGMLIEPIDKRPKLSNLFYSLSLGYFANLAFPRLGEVTRCTALYEVEKTPIDALFGTVIAERIIDVITLLILIFLSIISNVKLFGDYFMKMFRDHFLISTRFSSNAVIIILVVVAICFLFAYGLRKRIVQWTFVRKAVLFFKGIMDGLRSVLKLKKRKEFLFHSVLIWFLYYLSTYVSFFSIPETSNLGFSAALFILVLGGLGMSAPVQGGIGVYHVMVASGLTLFGIVPFIDPHTGDQISKGLLFATIVHSSQMLLTLILGSISIVMLNIEKRKELRNEKA